MWGTAQANIKNPRSFGDKMGKAFTEIGKGFADFGKGVKGLFKKSK